MTFAHIRNIEAARINLSQFAIRKADEIAKKIGFGYIDVAAAPDDFNELKTAWNASKSTGHALPVWRGASENTIYTNAGANWAFRFWHDVLHCVLNKGFSTAEEIAIGAIHVREVQEFFGQTSLEALLMYADTIGQSLYAKGNNGQFPENQLEWVVSQLPAYIARFDTETQFAVLRLIREPMEA
jgi:hypothetical protein